MQRETSARMASEQTAGRMKLSTSIRLGAMLHPQCFDSYVAVNDSLKIVATCAMGAAGTAGYSFDSSFLKEGTTCPACEFSPPNKSWRYTIIVHLNDDHRWTREQIADWVAVSEPSPAPSAVPQCEQLAKVAV